MVVLPCGASSTPCSLHQAARRSAIGVGAPGVKGEQRRLEVRQRVLRCEELGVGAPVGGGGHGLVPPIELASAKAATAVAEMASEVVTRLIPFAVLRFELRCGVLVGKTRMRCVFCNAGCKPAGDMSNMVAD